MRIKIKIGISLLMWFVLSNCNKYSRDNFKDFPECVGDFEWRETIVDGNTVLEQADINTKFGIRIRKNGRVTFYKNSQEYTQGDAIVRAEPSRTVITVTTFEEKYSLILYPESKQLEVSKYPFNYYRNVFLKH